MINGQVAAQIKAQTDQWADSDIYLAEKLPPKFDMLEYDAVVIGFPTIHSAPAKPILAFFGKTK